MPEEQELRLSVTLDDKASEQLGRLQQTLQNLSGSASNTSGLNNFARGLQNAGQHANNLHGNLMGMAAKGGFIGGFFFEVGRQVHKMASEFAEAVLDIKAYSDEMVRLDQNAQRAATSMAQFRSNVAIFRESGVSAEQATRMLQGYSGALADLQRQDSRIRQQLLAGQRGAFRERMEEVIRAVQTGSQTEGISAVREAGRRIREEWESRGQPERGAAAEASFYARLGMPGLEKVRGQLREVTAAERQMYQDRKEGSERFQTALEKQADSGDRLVKSLQAIAFEVLPITTASELLAHWWEGIVKSVEEYERNLRRAKTAVENTAQGLPWWAGFDPRNVSPSLGGPYAEQLIKVQRARDIVMNPPPMDQTPTGMDIEFDPMRGAPNRWPRGGAAGTPGYYRRPAAAARFMGGGIEGGAAEGAGVGSETQRAYEANIEQIDDLSDEFRRLNEFFQAAELSGLKPGDVLAGRAGGRGGGRDGRGSPDSTSQSSPTDATSTTASGVTPPGHEAPLPAQIPWPEPSAGNVIPPGFGAGPAPVGPAGAPAIPGVTPAIPGQAIPPSVVPPGWGPSGGGQPWGTTPGGGAAQYAPGAAPPGAAPPAGGGGGGGTSDVALPAGSGGAGFYQKALTAFKGSSLIGVVPPDGARFGIKTGSAEEWARFATAVANEESSFRPGTVGPKGDPGGSFGILQYAHKQVPGGNAFDVDASVKAFVRDAEKSVKEGGIRDAPGGVGGRSLLARRFSTIGKHPERTVRSLPLAQKISQAAPPSQPAAPSQQPTAPQTAAAQPAAPQAATTTDAPVAPGPRVTVTDEDRTAAYGRFLGAGGAQRVAEVQAKEAETRRQPIDPRLQEALQYAAETSGTYARVTSGGQPHIHSVAGQRRGARTGSRRHDLGLAADLDIRDEKGNQIPRDDPRRLKFLEEAAAAGAAGTGTGYMSDPLKVHIGLTGSTGEIGKGLGQYYQGKGTAAERAAIRRGLERFYKNPNLLAERREAAKGQQRGGGAAAAAPGAAYPAVPYVNLPGLGPKPLTSDILTTPGATTPAPGAVASIDTTQRPGASRTDPGGALDARTLDSTPGQRVDVNGTGKVTIDVKNDPRFTTTRDEPLSRDVPISKQTQMTPASPTGSEANVEE